MPKETDSMEIDLRNQHAGHSPLARRTRAKTIIRLHDGTLLSGVLSTGPNYHRVSDYLNDTKAKEKDFLVLVDAQNKAHIINKRYIVTVVEEE